jgi:predicted transcriptional regulator
MEPEKKKRGRKPKLEIGIREPHVKIYKFISQFIHRRKFGPNQKEIAMNTDISYRQVNRLVKDLVILGYIKKDPVIEIIKEL